jgi:hypothetical protein
LAHLDAQRRQVVERGERGRMVPSEDADGVFGVLVGDFRRL